MRTFLERRIGDGVGRVRRERGGDKRAVLERVVQLQALVQVFVGVTGPGAREIDQDQADAGAYSGRLHRARGGVREKIHIVEAGGAGFQHLGDGELAAVVHELGADPFRFRRPHVVLQPVHQRQVVGHAAKQTHGRVRMGVNQARHQRVFRQVYGFFRLITRCGVTAVEHGDNAAAIDGEAVALEHAAFRFHRNDPARMDEGVDDLHGGMSGQYTATSIRYTRGMPTIDPASVPYDRIRAVEWEQGRLKLIDQRVLPGKFTHLYLDSLPEVAQAIRDMVVRGAPAIGVTAAYAVVLVARDRYKESPGGWQKAIQPDLELLSQARPTAVNLRWAVEHMRSIINAGISGDPVPRLLSEAQRIHAEDIAANRRMGNLGAALIATGSGVLTHCNTGSLATGGYGTALGVVRAGVRGRAHPRMFLPMKPGRGYRARG